jgi:transcriptional regulator with XRE-family HTH domain
MTPPQHRPNPPEPDQPGAAASEAALLARLGLRVKVVRTSRRMTQDELAQAAGLDRTYISRIERGAHNITVLTLTRIAEALDVAPGELLDSAITNDDRVTGLPTRNNHQPPRPDQPPGPQVAHSPPPVPRRRRNSLSARVVG